MLQHLVCLPFSVSVEQVQRRDKEEAMSCKWEWVIIEAFWFIFIGSWIQNLFMYFFFGKGASYIATILGSGILVLYKWQNRYTFDD